MKYSLITFKKSHKKSLPELVKYEAKKVRLQVALYFQGGKPRGYPQPCKIKTHSPEIL